MPMTPDDMPDNDEMKAQPGTPRRNGAGANGAGTASMASSAEEEADEADEDTTDEAGSIYDSPDDEEELEGFGQAFSDMVRQSPVGAVIAAFVVGFLVSRLI